MFSKKLSGDYLRYFFGENNRYSLVGRIGETLEATIGATLVATLGETFGATLGETLDVNIGQKKNLIKKKNLFLGFQPWTN